ncbi:LysR substrate-binding domain-containing protein [Chachezhania sediminis]|uniref:LysR substrate-binding domain-containing protein n=1 Tax=Chachezhania sediminis TaxID=2599291 RepID=UPI00131C693C|nr:LysR substrate-binding domain-containing protein [Chachezhania sediminis]
MEIRGLKTFLLVADLGTAVEAARQLNCVQSNVTSRIKALEDELGVVLFIRSRTGMTLTSAGIVLRDHARAVLRAERDASAAMAGFADESGLLRIGSMESTLAGPLPARLAAFRRRYPGVKLHITAAPTEELAEKVLDGQIDIALVGGPYRQEALTCTPVFDEEMVLVTEPALTAPPAAARAPVIVFRAGCSYRSYALDWLRRTGLAPNNIMEMGTLDGILGCVAAGVGITLLPRSAVGGGAHDGRLRLHPLDDPDRFIPTHAIWRDIGPNVQIDRFVHLLRASESGLYEDLQADSI